MSAVLNMIAPAKVSARVSDAMVLVDMSISVWTGIKQDKSASKKVADDAGAATGVANVTKKLLGDCAELDAVKKFAANVRNTHYALTKPWSDLGQRICPTVRYVTKYEPEMSGLQIEFARLVQQFLDAYQWEIQNAQLKLGALFNPDEYPSVESLKSKFRFKYIGMPMPTANDWRIDLEDEVAEQLRAQYQKHYEEQLTGAMKDVWGGLHDVLSKMSERIDYADGETKKVFRDSLVDNVYEAIEVLEDFNVTGDKHMTAAADRLRDILSGVTADGLREDPYMRRKTKAEVDEVRKIIDNLPGFGF